MLIALPPKFLPKVVEAVVKPQRAALPHRQSRHPEIPDGEHRGELRQTRRLRSDSGLELRVVTGKPVRHGRQLWMAKMLCQVGNHTRDVSDIPVFAVPVA